MDASKQAERSTGPRPEQECKVERRGERELFTHLVKLVMVIFRGHPLHFILVDAISLACGGTLTPRRVNYATNLDRE